MPVVIVVVVVVEIFILESFEKVSMFRFNSIRGFFTFYFFSLLLKGVSLTKINNQLIVLSRDRE